MVHNKIVLILKQGRSILMSTEASIASTGCSQGRMYTKLLLQTSMYKIF
jgi:hypothetical protein